MKASGGIFLHSQAAKYYYDCLVEPGLGVPNPVMGHICRCEVCLTEIHRLKESLAGMEPIDSQRDQMDHEIIDRLNRHFHSLDEPVTCSRTKPFLPDLVLTREKIRIPTPITAHVDHCPDCASDLHELSGLGLRPEQLARLEGLYRESVELDRAFCPRARTAIPAFAACSLEGLDPNVLDHFATCPDCREQVYQHRQKLIDAMGDESADGPACCDGVTTADVFDYVVPHGLAGRSAPEGGTRAAENHVRSCRRCLEKVQTLHLAVYRIADRADSGVTTVFQTIEDDQRVATPGDPYPGYPVDVQVIRSEPETAVPARSRTGIIAASVRRIAARPMVARWVAAAAVIALALPLTLLFLHTPTASGITLSQVLSALAEADNVHLVKTYRDTEEVIQEIWISRKLRIALVAAPGRRTLYDLEHRQMKEMGGSGQPTIERELTGRERVRLGIWMESVLAFVSEDVSADATWQIVDTLESQGLEIYELTWGATNQLGDLVHRKSKVAVHSDSGLPAVATSFRMESAGNTWEHLFTGRYEYPTDEEMAVRLGR